MRYPGVRVGVLLHSQSWAPRYCSGVDSWVECHQQPVVDRREVLDRVGDRPRVIACEAVLAHHLFVKVLKAAASAEDAVDQQSVLVDQRLVDALVDEVPDREADLRADCKTEPQSYLSVFSPYVSLVHVPIPFE